MAMPRKGSRLIMVDGISYRWILSNHHALCVADRDIIVELAENPGTTLVAKPTAIDCCFGDDYDYEITPALIEAGIRKAIQHGWCPADSGTFRLRGEHDGPAG